MFLRAFGIPTSGKGSINPADFDGFALLPTSSPNGDLTKGDLNYLNFDKEMTFITASFDVITAEANTSQTLSLYLTADQEGFVFVYVTNEEPTAKDIFR
ncbi:hypothetical protein AB9P05_21000 [Roseivirga sp. BDSF3-8]|uniref:hypothetical protein n=1 Tax=Roseivirga sp. BDSF3-8 TaxID=3241598 RepID=UPI0035322912